MSTLGDRLRDQEAERKRLGRLAVEERERLDQQRYAERAEQVRAKFEDAKNEITSAIEQNRTPVPTKAEDREPWWFNQKAPNDPKHPYHFVFTEAETWAAENGLALKVKHQHDGGGITGWLEISFGVAPEHGRGGRPGQ